MVHSCHHYSNFVQVIIEVNDCALNLMGESQEEDRRQIAEMVLKEMGVQCVQPMAPHTNGHVESAAAEKSSERVEEREERKEKSLPGPVQRGPQRRISSSQGRTLLLFTLVSISPTHWLYWPIIHCSASGYLFSITFHADSYDSTG